MRPVNKFLTMVWVGFAWVISGFPGDARSRRGRLMCWLIRVDSERVDKAVQVELDADEYPTERDAWAKSDSA